MSATLILFQGTGCSTTQQGSAEHAPTKAIHGTWILNADLTKEANTFVPAEMRDRVFAGLKAIEFKVNFTDKYFTSQLGEATSYEAFKVVKKKEDALKLGFFSRDGEDIVREATVQAKGNHLVMFAGPFLYLFDRAPEILPDTLMDSEETGSQEMAPFGGDVDDDVDKDE